MNFNFKNRTVIVTGGRGGIGQSISEKFIKFGANVIITTRNKNKLNTKSKKNHFVYLDFNDEIIKMSCVTYKRKIFDYKT